MGAFKLRLEYSHGILGPLTRQLVALVNTQKNYNGRSLTIFSFRSARSPIRTRPNIQATCPQGTRPPRTPILGRNIRTHCTHVRHRILSLLFTRSSPSRSEALYESDDLSKAARDSAALLASKVYYFLGEYDEALSFALGAGSAFEAEARNYGAEEYVETIICEYLCLLSLPSPLHQHRVRCVKPRPSIGTSSCGVKNRPESRKSLARDYSSLSSAFSHNASKTANIDRFLTVSLIRPISGFLYRGTCS